MLRAIFILITLVGPAAAAELRLFANCGNVTLNRVDVMPPLVNSDSLGCDGVNGAAVFQVFFITANASKLNTEYRTTVDGLFVPLGHNFAFWNPCLSVSVLTGTSSFSGHIGPDTFGTPCDFAHALPLGVPVREDVTVDAIGTGTEFLTGITVSLGGKVFDADGNPVTGGFDIGFFPLPDEIPEPSTGAPTALAVLLCLAHRWFHKKHTT